MRAPWKTEVRTTMSDAKTRRKYGIKDPQKARRDATKRIVRKGRAAEWKRRMKGWRKVRARKGKRGTLVGGFRELVYLFAGLSIATSVLSYMFSWPGGLTGGLVGAGTSGAVGYGHKVWKDKKGGRRVPRRHQDAVVRSFSGHVDRKMKQHQQATTAAGATKPNTAKTRPPKTSSCKASCRRSKQPKSKCRCTAVPCLHGQDA